MQLQSYVNSAFYSKFVAFAQL